MTARRVLRYEVPVDDQWHRIDNPGRKVGPIAARRPDVVENAAYVGTTLAADGALVWHLFKREVSR